jgi:hypothetical protein
LTASFPVVAIQALPVRSELLGQRFEEGQALPGRQRPIAGEHLLRDRHAGGFAATGEQCGGEHGQRAHARLGIPADEAEQIVDHAMGSHGQGLAGRGRGDQCSIPRATGSATASGALRS